MDSSLDLIISGFIATSFQQKIFDLNQLDTLGLKLEFNNFGSQKRFVGDRNLNIFPNIVIWKPNQNDLTTGTTIAAVLVETVSSLKNPDINKWLFLSSIQILFDLLIPETELQNVQSLIRNKNLLSIKLFTYRYDQILKQYIFNKYDN
jgi:hypothetical protein